MTTETIQTTRSLTNCNCVLGWWSSLCHFISEHNSIIWTVYYKQKKAIRQM